MFARKIPFVFNSRDALVLVFRDHVMTVVQNGAPVLSGAAPYALATPYAAADLGRLTYVQSANVVTLAHPNYPPYELTRVANNNWTLAPISFGATMVPPTALQLDPLTTAMDEDLFAWDFVVTSVGADGEESLQSTNVIAASIGDVKHPLVLSWVAAANAVSYRIYRRPPASGPRYSGPQQNVGAYGFVGVSSTLQFIDHGHDPDFLQQPPVQKTVFAAAGDYPSAVGLWQQRRVFANTNNNPDTTWMSQVGRFKNFNVSIPLKDDDAITFRLVSETVDEIRHIVAQGQLTLLAEGGEWTIYGDQNGILSPGSVTPRKTSSHGVGLVRPTPSSVGLLFPQALGSSILELTGAQARDLTLFSTHLFDGHEIIDMAWQQETPHVAWMVRDDGVLLGLTYIPDQDVIAWHRHDMDGFVESVCVIPEVVGARIEHRVYVTVGRVLSGAMVTFTIECFASPFSKAIDQDAWFVDGGVEYDGRATLTPASSLSGLDHLEGRAVAIYAFSKVVAGTPDGKAHVIANPLRPELAIVTVSGGTITLPDSYLRFVVGLPFIADLETLDLDSSQGPTMKTQRTNVSRVGLQVLDTRNVWAGGALPSDATPTLDMAPQALSTDSDFDTLVTDFVEINTQGQWNTNGRVALRSIDPTPFTVLSAVPEGYFPNPQES